MSAQGPRANSFGTFMVIGPTCFFLGILFIMLPYDYYVLWSSPPGDRSPYFDTLETHLRFLHASPPLISRILHIVIGTGIFGFITKLYKPSEANMLFDGASLVLYMCGVTVYIANIVKGLRIVTQGDYGAEPEGGRTTQEIKTGTEGEYITREDSLRVLAASHTILALVLVGVLVLQAGQWYAMKKEEQEVEAMEKKEAEDRKKIKKRL